MRKISNALEHNESLEQMTSKLGKTVKLISLGIDGRYPGNLKKPA